MSRFESTATSFDTVRRPAWSASYRGGGIGVGVRSRLGNAQTGGGEGDLHKNAAGEFIPSCCKPYSGVYGLGLDIDSGVEGVLADKTDMV